MSWRATGRTLRVLKQVRGVKRKPPEPIKHWNIKKGDTVGVGTYLHSVEYCVCVCVCRCKFWQAETKASKGK